MSSMNAHCICLALPVVMLLGAAARPPALERGMPLYPKLVKPVRRLAPDHLVMLTRDPFDTAVAFYLKAPRERGWRLVSPTPGGLEAWRQANSKARPGQQAIVLILTKPKEKLNCKIEIGSVRRPGPFTIISLRISNRGFAP